MYVLRFLLAATTSCVIASIVLLLGISIIDPDPDAARMALNPLAWAFGVVVGIVPAIVVGLLMTTFAEVRPRFSRPRFYAIAGALAGLLLFAFVLVGLPDDARTDGFALLLPLGALVGAAAALTFRLVLPPRKDRALNHLS